MGDIIRIVEIALIHNERYQIDLHNVTKNEYYRLFVSKKELETKLKTAKDLVGEDNG